MTLTKKDKEEIKALIKEALGDKNALKTDAAPTTNCDSDAWRKNGVHSEMLNATIAPENLVVTLSDGTEKKYFTFDEAQEYTKDLPDGWRLPTRSEWCILAEEFGNDPETGELNGILLMKNLNLNLDGYIDDDDGELYAQASRGVLWSGTTYSDANGYDLSYGSGGIYPADYYNRGYGFPVRCIARELKKSTGTFGTPLQPS